MTAPRTQARELALGSLLDAAVADQCVAWLDGPGGADDPEWDGGLRVLGLVLAMRWAEASAVAEALPDVPPDDRDAWWLRYAASLWASSGDPGPGSAVALELLAEAGTPDPGTPLGRFTGHLQSSVRHRRLDQEVPREPSQGRARIRRTASASGSSATADPGPGSPELAHREAA